MDETQSDAVEEQDTLQNQFSRWSSIILMVAILAVAGVVSALTAMRFAIRGREVEVPEVIGKTKEEAEEILLRWYLRAFGPATAADFALWSGIALTHAREIWARQQADFAPVNVEGWEAAILRDDLPQLAQADFAPPLVRLLPYFDSFLLGHREREHLVGTKHKTKIYRPQGWIAPVVLVDGQVAGVWEHTRDKNGLNVKVTQFGSTSRRTAAGIREEAQNLSHFLGSPKVDVQIN